MLSTLVEVIALGFLHAGIVGATHPRRAGPGMFGDGQVGLVAMSAGLGSRICILPLRLRGDLPSRV